MAAWKRRLLLFFLTILIAIPVIFAVWSWAALSFVYAHGERAGFVQKISSKGWLCKTWEGELAMANLPGAMPQMFAFTVRDDAVAHLIEQNAGRRVSLSYEQHPGIPTSCFGDTEYFIVKVTPVEDPAPPPAGVVPAPATPAPVPAAPAATPAPAVEPAPAPAPAPAATPPAEPAKK